MLKRWCGDLSRLLGGALVGLGLLCSPAVAQDGKISVIYAGATTKEHQLVERIFKENQPFEAMAASYNAKFFFPREIWVVVAETGRADCWYSPDQHRIYVSYEMLDFLFALFSKTEKEMEARGDALNTLFFLVLHEMAHALIAELDIPTTGREEDAADDFAALTVLQVGGSARAQAIAAAKWYAIMGARNNQDLPFWDDHALDMQRFYSILGILYGGDPNRFNFVEQIVPKDSLGRFRHDYPRKLLSWERLLSSHFRNKRPLGQNLKI